MPLGIALGIILVVARRDVDRVRARNRDPGRPTSRSPTKARGTSSTSSLLFDLSGDELRDGLRREQFVAREARGVREHGEPRVGWRARSSSTTSSRRSRRPSSRRGSSTDEGMVQNRCCSRSAPNGWLVVGYSIRTDVTPTVRRRSC